MKRGPCQVALESQREKTTTVWLLQGKVLGKLAGGSFSPQPRVGHACVLPVYFKRGDGPAC